MQKSGEITYYEELGVSNSASTEEIREAFRVLVRLMHPDQQTDEQLKMMADWQMRKINRIYAVLSDPDRRRRYDRSLEAVPSAPTIVFSRDSRVNLHRLVARFAWIGAVLVTVIVLIWLASDGPSPMPLPVVEHVNAQKQPAPAGTREELTQLRSELTTAKVERDAAVHELVRLRGISEKKPESVPVIQPPAPERVAVIPPPAAAAVTELPAPNRAVPAPSAIPVRGQPAPQKKFAGFWFYTRPGQGQKNHNTSLYPPEYIEATITEQGALVHGRYRSRYQIVDRAISPDVTFEFTGTAEGSILACNWMGPGGARGELTLKLTGENSMEMAWTAHELGSIQGLAAGTARLTRRSE